MSDPKDRELALALGWTQGNVQVEDGQQQPCWFDPDGKPHEHPPRYGRDWAVLGPELIDVDFYCVYDYGLWNGTIRKGLCISYGDGETQLIALRNAVLAWRKRDE